MDYPGSPKPRIQSDASLSESYAPVNVSSTSSIQTVDDRSTPKLPDERFRTTDKIPDDVIVRAQSAFIKIEISNWDKMCVEAI